MTLLLTCNVPCEHAAWVQVWWGRRPQFHAYCCHQNCLYM